MPARCLRAREREPGAPLPGADRALWNSPPRTEDHDRADTDVAACGSPVTLSAKVNTHGMTMAASRRASARTASRPDAEGRASSSEASRLGRRLRRLPPRPGILAEHAALDVGLPAGLFGYPHGVVGSVGYSAGASSNSRPRTDHSRRRAEEHEHATLQPTQRSEHERQRPHHLYRRGARDGRPGRRPRPDVGRRPGGRSAHSRGDGRRRWGHQSRAALRDRLRGVFESSLGVVARRRRQEVGDVAIESRVMLLATRERGFKLAVAFAVSLPSVDDPDEAIELVRAGDLVCPYSNATRGNIDVSLTANGRVVERTAEPATA